MKDGRPLRVGDTLSEVLDLYRKHFAVLLPAAFWLYLPVGILLGVAQGSNTVLLVLLLSLVVSTVFQGMVVSVVHGGNDAPSVREVLTSVTPVLPTLIAGGLVYALGAMIGAFFFLVPALLLITIWALIAPVIVIEKLGVTAALNRSQLLVRDYGWRVFGTILAAVLIATVAGVIFAGVIGLVAGGPIVRVVLATLASAVAAPINGLVAVVLYYRLKDLKGDRDPMMPPPLDREA